jgi:hypothetical protein
MYKFYNLCAVLMKFLLSLYKRASNRALFLYTNLKTHLYLSKEVRSVNLVLNYERYY